VGGSDGTRMGKLNPPSTFFFFFLFFTPTDCLDASNNERLGQVGKKQTTFDRLLGSVQSTLNLISEQRSSRHGDMAGSIEGGNALLLLPSPKTLDSGGGGMRGGLS